MLRQWFLKHRAYSPLGPASFVLFAGVAAVATYVATRSRESVGIIVEATEIEGTNKPKIVPYLQSKVPYIGNMIALASNAHRFHDWMAEQCIAHNGMFKLHLPGQSDMLVTAVPEHYEHVVKTQFEHFRKGKHQYEMFVDLMGHSVLLIEGERWKYHRRLLIQLLNARAIREHMMPVMQRHTLLLQQVLTKAANSKNSIDLYMLMHRFTFKAFAEMAFNNSLDTLDSEHEHPFEHAFDEAQSIVAGRLQQPVWLWKLKRWLNVGQERKLRDDVTLIDEFIMTIISKAIAIRHQRQQKCQNGKAVPQIEQDIVSIVLECMEQDGDLVSPTDVRNIAVAALGAGRDTSADAMSWLIHTLTQHPQVEMKLQAELHAKLPQLLSSHTYVPSIDELHGLTYLDATIRELLRLQTPVPFTMRECVHDTIFSDGTFIPKGMTVGMCHYGAARWTKVWGPDAAQFRPERFIDPTTGKLLHTPVAKFNAFSGGQRACVGKTLAMLEMKLVIATLVGRFHFIEIPGQNVKYAMGITIGMKNSLYMNVESLVIPGQAA
ncbi:Cytochrome P450, E-class, group I [Plasmopara halstedii]|uniref:Cytochrome P450, E-class, group I n=1 Tax=Plasmopara halstedii TaxID=4781 RepID=A0A0P1B5H2_PLAHL|nr:Cytochrome P450, E-class, group I [Plasmopara halstedii]CEG49609.1 Cytochrome P450, E-class, group I [Plasmopara halstedii]|eukprot:XP_024585978.1 Cytochrome P450, E-class, group I [Plasmopara halstedii]